jgi:hypothetical protein
LATDPTDAILVPYPDTLAALPMATHCRGTLLVASTRALKRHGHYERYQRHLTAEHFETIVSSAASTWLPIEVGIAHYEACDALGLPVDEQLAMGAEVVLELQRTFIGSVLRAASAGGGVSPIVGLKKFAAIFSRSVRGGGLRVVRLGPKDVRVEFVGLQLAAIRYFRIAYRGFIHAGCEFFSRRVIVAELDAFLSATTLAYRIAWV